MSWRRLWALAAKELRETVWMATSFTLVGCLLPAIGMWLRIGSPLRPTTASLDLLAVAIVFGLLLAERQAADLGTGTRRHLLSFPLQPLEVVTAKGLAFLIWAIPLVLVGTIALAQAAAVLAPPGPGAGSLAAAGWRIVLLGFTGWSFALATISWPRIGLAAALTCIAAYALGVAFIPTLRQLFNVGHLALLWMDEIALAGAAIAALFLSWCGLVLAACGLHSGKVET
jgi:hypothetical protein